MLICALTKEMCIYFHAINFNCHWKNATAYAVGYLSPIFAQNFNCNYFPLKSALFAYVLIDFAFYEAITVE